MKSKIINIEGMTCSACSNGLEKYLKKQDGIIDATVNLVLATAKINYDETRVKDVDLSKFVKEAGFKSLGEKRKDGNNKFALKLIILFSFLAFFLMYMSMGHMLKLPMNDILNKHIHPRIYTLTELLITIIFIIWGIDIIKNGIKNILHLMPNMDSLVGIGVIVNFLYSLYNSINIFNGNIYLVNNLYFESSCMIILFIKIGRYIDKKNKAKAVDTIKNLVTITPKTGTVLKDRKAVKVTINEIQKDDIVVSKPGEKIPIDGIVLKGKTHTDESFITGESKPVAKVQGDKVIAGSINYDGYIEIKAENIGKDSSISHIVDMVVDATNSKAPISRLADKISGYFVPAIFIIAIISLILNLVITHNFTKSILSLVTVLVVACPCSLGLATPLAMVVSIGRCSKRGILVKSSEALEAVNKIDTIAFDKTGTLTKGELQIVSKYGNNLEENLKILQSLEKNSNHPLAKSICKNVKDFYNVDDFEEISGYGVKGKINGILYFAGNRKYVEKLNIKNSCIEIEKELTSKGQSIVYFGTQAETLAIFGLRDEIKPEMKETLDKLKEQNKNIVMLSGDNKDVANQIASELDITDVYSNMNPKAKLVKIKELKNNKNIAMIGDGINDSPALKTATIGISVAEGTDISSDSSDIILLSNDMKKIVELFQISHKTMKIIKQNLFWALFYNLLMVPLATGVLPITLNPMIASLAMTLSSLTVVMNSLRLR